MCEYCDLKRMNENFASAMRKLIDNHEKKTHSLIDEAEEKSIQFMIQLDVLINAAVNVIQVASSSEVPSRELAEAINEMSSLIVPAKTEEVVTKFAVDGNVTFIPIKATTKH